MLGIVHYRTKERFIGIRFGRYGWTRTDPNWTPELTRDEVNEIWLAWSRFWKEVTCT